MTDEQHAYLIEATRVGNQVKVTAIDSATGMEAVVIMPANATKKEMTDLAVRKLKYQLAKKGNPTAS